MPKKYSQCPVAVPKNCPEFRNGRVCALCRPDKKCLRKFGASRPRILVNTMGGEHRPNKSKPLQNHNTTFKKPDILFTRRY